MKTGSLDTKESEFLSTTLRQDTGDNLIGLFKRMYDTELRSLLVSMPDKIQVYQGKVLVLKQILDLLKSLKKTKE